MRAPIQFFIILFLTTSTIGIAAERPKIGLVLSGGGARGAAHVGVLKVLEEMRIPIDVIAGTSMGSIVGGLYASGMNPDEIETTLTGMDWDYVLADDDSRDALSSNRKAQEDLFSLALSPGFSDGEVKFPPGAIQGQKIELALQRFTTHVAHIENFDELPIPFRAVATDIVDGGEFVLSKGNLGRAMRASMSVPSIFAPIEIEGHVLVDGGIVNNLPVNIAREMGADVLIVVDIGSPLRNREQIGNILTITDQLTRILTGRNVIASRASLNVEDILILPDLGTITSSQFDRSAEAIPTGETAARASSERLQALTISDEDYSAHLADRGNPSAQNRLVKGIALSNTSSIADRVLSQRVDVKQGEDLDLDQLERDIGQIHGLGTFEKVGYDLYQHQYGVDIEIYATPKSWGPNYLHFGVKADGDLSGDNGTNLMLGYTRTAVNSYAGDWTNLIQIGEEPLLISYFHQPIGLNLSYFVQPYVAIKRTNVNVFSGEDKLAEYRLHENEFELLVGKEFATRAVFSFGVNRTEGEANLLIGDTTLPEAKFDDGGAVIKFRYDTLNDIDFPSSGGFVRASYYQAYDGFGADEEYKQWRLRMARFSSFGKHTIGFGATLGSTDDGAASLARRFLLGGFLNISGLQNNQQSGEHKAVIQGIYYRKFDRIKMLPAYIGTTLEYGGVWQDRDDVNADSSVFAGSLFLGVDSPFGPLLLGWGYTDSGEQVFFTKVGRFFN